MSLAYNYSLNNENRCVMKKVKIFLIGLLVSIHASAYESFTGTTVEGYTVTYSIMGSNTVYVGSRSQSNIREPDSKGLKEYSSQVQGTVTIPSTVTLGDRTYNVCGIGKNAFNNYSGITQIILPDCIETINATAFQGCSSLTSFNLPASLTYIGNDAFKGCTGLQSVDIPGGVSSVKGFENCTALSEVRMGNGVQYISANAFKGCGNLANISLPNSVKSIGKFAFQGCSSIETLTIPASVTNIYDDAFTDCAFKKLVLEDGTEDLSVGYCASKAPSTFGLISANYGIFSLYASYYLEEAYVGRNIVCSSVPPFQNTGTLTTLVFGINVSKVEDYTYRGCGNLKSVTVKSRNDISFGSSVFSYISSDAIIYVPFGRKSKYTGLGFSSVVEAVPTLGDIMDVYIDSNGGKVKAAFTITRLSPNEITLRSVSNSIAGEVTIPDAIEYSSTSFKVTGIEASAFSESTGMTSVSIPKSVVSIWDAFEGCTSLKSVYVGWQDPNEIFIDDGNFNGISEDAVLYVPKGTKAIYESIDVWKKFSSVIVAADPLSAGEVVTHSGSQVSIPIILNHREEISGLTFKLALPENMSVVEENGNLSVSPTDKTENMTVMCHKDPEEDNSYLFVMFSLNGDPINSDDCTLMNIKVATAPGISEGDYDVSLEDVTLATSAYNTQFLAETKSQISITDKVKSIIFDDSKVKEICLANWDSNGDGELDTDEAAAVSSLDGAFSENADITSFDELQYFTGLTTIGSQEFNACNALTSLYIPSSVTEIEEGAFTNCEGLTFIVVDKNNAYYDSRKNCNAIIRSSENKLILGCVNSIIPQNVETIGSHAFSNCLGLTTLNIPNSVSVIDDGAFSGCSSLTTLDIPNSVTTIGANVFYGCSSLTALNVPNNITSIEEGTFYGCSALASLEIPDAVTSIGAKAFEGCSNLAALDLPNGLKNIGTNAFAGCSRLTMLAIPQNVITIGEGAFYDCHSLNTITVDENNANYDSRDGCNAIIETATNRLMFGSNNTVIPNSITTIGIGAFVNIEGLTMVTVPDNTDIGERAFDGCVNLTVIKMKNATPVDIRENVFSNRTNATLYVPTGSLDDYMTANYWNEFKIIKAYPDGDVNQDGETDVVDVVDVARFVVGKSRDVFDEYLADLNNDDLVTVADAVVLVNLIAGDTNFANSRYLEMTANDMLSLNEKTDQNLSFELKGNGQYTAFQFNLTLPEDVDVTQMTLSPQRKQKHQLLYNKVSDGKYRVIVLSISNRVFLGTAGELLNISVDGLITDEIRVDDIHFVTPQGYDVPFGAVTISRVATGVSRAEGDSSGHENHIFNISGQQISVPQKGLNIINGKKVVIK